MGTVELAAVTLTRSTRRRWLLLTQSLSDRNSTDRSTVPGYIGFEISVSRADGVVIVQVVGDLDCYTAPELRAVLLGLVADGSNEVVLDVGQSSFIDSTGLSVLVGGLRRLRQEGGDMVLRAPTPATIALLEITGVIKLFEIA